jgi:hypothetical protein
MATKDRDYEAIIKGCDNLMSALELLEAAGKALSTCAASAEATLKDKVGKKDVEGAIEIATAISDGIKGAKESVSELKSELQKESNEFDEL